jgi:ATP-binding cassette subfamily B protein
MNFIINIAKDYKIGYTITASNYRNINPHLAITVFFILLISFLDALVPFILRETTNNISIKEHGEYGSIAILLAGAYGLCWTSARIFEWLKGIITAAIAARCDAAFQSEFYRRLIQADFSQLLTVDVGTTAAIVSRSRTAFSSITYTIFWIVVPTLFQLVASSAVLWKVTGWGFALAFWFAMLGLFFATWRLAAMSKDAFSTIFEADNILSSHLVEKLAFTLDIKINNSYRRENNSFTETLFRFISNVSRGHTRLAIIMAIQSLATGLVLTAFTISTTTGAMRGAYTVGDFVMIIGYILQLTMPFSSLSASLSDLRRNHLALREGFDILNMKLEMGNNNVKFDTTSSSVFKIDSARLVLNGRHILTIPSFQAAVGKLTVVIGPSGSGKSSLLHLLMGLIRPASGSICVYGTDIADASTAAISQVVAMAPQHPMIVTGTLRDNLNYGCDEPCEDSFLMEIVDDLELGGFRSGSETDVLDQPLGIQGRELSGGEKQRIALARALARRPTVLILDEPTSSIDPARETKMIATLRKRVPTIVAVTHRDALREAADVVYEVDAGHLHLAPRNKSAEDVSPVSGRVAPI